MVSPITTHVLDISKGCPAEGLHVTLEIFEQNQWQMLGTGSTNSRGRVEDLLKNDHGLKTGIYRLRFEVGTYLGPQGFYSVIPVEFKIDNPNEHFHIPLLISRFGYSTYRGSA